MNLINLFPTQIGTYNINLDKTLINLVMNDYQISSHELLNGSKSSYGITNTKFLNDKRLKNLLDEIYSKLNDYTNQLSLVPLDISGSWFNEMDDGGIEELISTRRLVHILRAYSIFKNKAKAIQVCINRFDDETKQSFMELYDKVDADFEIPENNESVEKV